MLKVGSLVNGTYKILSEIGRGGMSVVYLAINERANKTWAVKEIRKDGVSDFQVVKQGLIVETEMLKSFDHPYLPSIIDVIDGEDSFVIVMDYIQGKSLEKVLELSNNQPQKEEDVVRWAMQLCDVLGYLHTREPPIVYRDMKPANVMLKPDNNITLIDFGTARKFKNSSVADTVCLGTRGYAAPEQYGGMGQTDARTDIYCLGATLYHLLTGHSPADPPYEIYPIGKWIPAYADSGLEQIISKCTQQDPNERYQSCAELLYDLEHMGDMKKELRLARERQWRAFLASGLVFCIGLAGIIGFRTAWNAQINSSYEAFLGNAQNATSQQQAAEFYKKAIAMAPARSEGYDELLSLMDSNYEITSEEIQLLTAAVMSTDGGTKTSIESLKNADREAYDTFSYRLANDYYFFYEGSDNRAKAAAWYKEVLDSKYLSEQQKEIANCLFKIGNYYSSLGSSSKYDFVDEGSTYQDYWNDLVAMTDGDLVERTGQAYVALGLYKDLAVEIYRLAPQFKAVGITQPQMEQQLDKVLQGLEKIVPEDKEDSAQIQIITQNVEQAQALVRTTFV